MQIFSDRFIESLTDDQKMWVAGAMFIVVLVFFALFLVGIAFSFGGKIDDQEQDLARSRRFAADEADYQLRRSINQVLEEHGMKSSRGSSTRWPF